MSHSPMPVSTPLSQQKQKQNRRFSEFSPLLPMFKQAGFHWWPANAKQPSCDGFRITHLNLRGSILRPFTDFCGPAVPSRNASRFYAMHHHFVFRNVRWLNHRTSSFFGTRGGQPPRLFLISAVYRSHSQSPGAGWYRRSVRQRCLLP